MANNTTNATANQAMNRLPCQIQHLALEDLPQHILMEISARLASNEALQCRSISRKFSELISDPAFCRRFIQIRSNEQPNRDLFLIRLSNNHVLVSFLTKSALNLSREKISSSSRDFFQSLNANLIRILKLKRRPRLDMIASSNGLILFKTLELNYVVCNPLTKKWVLLPPPPQFHVFYCSPSWPLVLKGFICQPHYEVQEEGSVTLNNPPIFNVVLLKPCQEPTGDDEETTEPYLGMQNHLDELFYSSQTGQWTCYHFSLPEPFEQGWTSLPGIPYRGKLYFMGETSCLVRDDPFNLDNGAQNQILPHPLNSDPIRRRGLVGLSSGNLLLAEIDPDINQGQLTVKTWRLIEEPLGWLPLDSNVLPRFKKKKRTPVDLKEWFIRAFHPLHEDILIFEHHGRLHTGNLSTNLFREIGPGINQLMDIISIEFPWWPTPLPALQP